MRTGAEMDLRVLGNVEIHFDGAIITLDRAAERCVLAIFSLNPGRPVQTETLIDNVWGDQQPAKAEQTIANYVRAVRKAIEQAGGRRDFLRNMRPRAYILDIDVSMVDYHRFSALAARGRAKARAGEHHDAATAYQEALNLWRGDPLANVSGEWAERCRHALRQEHLDAACALLTQQLKVGDYAAVASRATQMITDVIPTDRLITLGIYGLARSGNQAMVPRFLARATQRMWEAAQVRPGPSITELARKLVEQPADPGVEIAQPAPVTNVSQNTGLAQPVQTDAPDDGTEYDRVIMIATHNENVYQAGRDQYIFEP